MKSQRVLDADHDGPVVDEQPLGLYVHVPFCRTKCTYCDFTAFAGLGHRANDYLEAVDREAAFRASRTRRPVTTVFFGGGTPSELTLPQLRRCLDFVPRRFSVASNASIELEANPETVDPERLAVMREGGVSRLSIGVQSFHDAELRAIARFHGARGAVDSVRAARAAGFDSISLDLMLGIPGQTMETWRATLDQALALEPDHLSAYGLTLEPATPLAKQVRRGQVGLPDDDQQAAMYDAACDVLARAGYRHYEVSNWAQPGCESAHNRRYWRALDYVGLGAGAASTLDGRRWTNHRTLERYIRSALVTGTAEAEAERLEARQAQMEMVMLGLRTAEGVSNEGFQRHNGMSLRAWGGERLTTLEASGLLEWHGEALVVPEERWFVLQAIVAELASGA